ncbi:MAG: exodeoxyribonuclease VII large subunit [Lentisphaerota bacterium]
MPYPAEDSLFNQDRRRIYAVAEITRVIKTALENEIGIVWVEGEVSNLRRPSSGHLYFTLKDESAQIRAVFFKGSQAGTSFEIKDGLKLRVYGQIGVYERSGDYQIMVKKVEDAGKGQLQAAFEALKKKLALEGLFDEARKKPIPILPQHVAVVTSPTGAAIRDILNILTRRFPNLHVLIAPVKVQGEGASDQIAHALNFLNERGGLDVIIVGRGGGSLEDLWCFNEETVARAIARSNIPVISAVGHEIDFTISDFVADLRAPTPSAAAELVVGRKEAFEEQVTQHSHRLGKSLKMALLEIKNRFQSAAQSYVFKEPGNLVRQFAQRIDAFEIKLAHAMKSVPDTRRRELSQLSLRLHHPMEMLIKTRSMDIHRWSSQLQALSPEAVLGRGFSITQTRQGKIVRTTADVQPGDGVVTRLAQGTFESTITAKTQGG